nr:lycopene cyclase family protein [Pseudenhygromyxa sp. WMMC2535]
MWIVGAGPAGLGLAEACCARGLRVGLLDPEPEHSWVPNYGLWRDDAESLGVADFFGHRWERALVELEAGPRLLDRGYGLLDGDALQRAWLGRCREAGARILAGRLAAIEHDDEGAALRLESGELERAKLVVDATGHGSPFVALEDGPAPGYQVAWGELWAIDALPEAFAGGRTMGFMDWRAVTDEAHEAGEDALPPTFLYALPVAEDRLFVEETVLVARPPQGRRPGDWLEPLEDRLRRRLAQQGVDQALRGGAPLAVERCVIPMGGPLPRGDQLTLAFGGAAAMVHPATGYMLTAALRRRAPVAERIAEEVGAWAGPGAPSQRIWRSIWPDERVRAWRLYTFGMDVLARLDRPGIDRFFAEFFALGDERWREFVSASASTPALMGTMLRYFSAAPWSIQRRLGAALVGSEGRRLLAGFRGLRG